MADLVMVLIFLAFTALCVVYVSWCDRIIGPDPVRAEVDDGSTSVPSHEAAA